MSARSEAIRKKELASTRMFLAVVALAVFITVLTGTMINVLIPLMRAEFGASAAQIGWS
jgi:Mg/Co/Ni transporter MgtE